MTEREFVVKSLPAIRLAERSATAATQPEIGPLVGPLFDEVADALMAAGAQLGLGVAYYVGTGNATECHAGFEYSGDRADGFDIGELPEEAEAVALVHLGSMEGITDSWGAVFGWLGESGFTPSGPCREVYLEAPMGDQDAWVTELQQPFVRRS
jgi:effector-binding domain-containing protein